MHDRVCLYRRFFGAYKLWAESTRPSNSLVCYYRLSWNKITPPPTHTHTHPHSCSTLPRMHRLPPLTTSRPPSAAALSSLQTLSENVPLAAESVTNLSAIERPRSRVQSSEGESLPRLSLHLADDIGLGDTTSDDAFRSMV